ncbi:MAG: isoleucine--tRNA ligase [Cyanobacteriota bacterium]|nr:isoleucine--tRNA ligase [Cyanobacteriota bacterium]
MTASPANSYKDTLNLLQTPFNMRADARRREPELQAFWAEKRLYERLSRENPGPSFTLHDGPPYANGALHVGHALNKILKDIINKTALLQGRRAVFVPGWDCHGLPIELKVLQGLSSRERQSLTPGTLREKAHRYALEQVEVQKSGFQRWGIWGDWQAPYLTLNRTYEAAQIGVFGAMVLAGHIYRGLKPVHWSPSSRTALAEAELEYPDGHVSPSVYVAFPVENLSQDLISKLGEAAVNLSLAIWTTTPWTLPANLAVSVNERLEYAICRVQNESTSGIRHLVVAHALVEQLESTLQVRLTERVRLRGAELEGVQYRLPVLQRSGRVVLGGDAITTETGTGLVHTAPGHGEDDFNTGRRYGLPVICAVDEAGNLTGEAGPFAGLNVMKDANPVIITALKETGALLGERPYEHRYPYDWRTKKPTIFRATEQWFASVKGFREAAMEAIAAVNWLPASGRNRIEAMVSERGDWCISRQRIWGVPIPVFYHRETGEVLLNQTTLHHIQSLIGEHGSDIWWEREEKDLLPPSYADEASLWRKGTDTMDVWFDSGSSWAGVLGGLQNGTAMASELTYPADLYLEGSDQHRGWFQSSLLTSVAVNGRAPYRQVLTHGFTLDEKGRKMSKSLGNVVDPTVLVEGGKNEKQDPAFGADVLRLWVSSVDYSADVPLGPGIVRQLADVYRKVRNTARYLLGNLHDFDPALHSVPLTELPLLDRWMLARTADLIDSVTADFQRFEFYRFFQALQNFCVVDLSNVYLDIAKDRLYVSRADAFRRRSCQTVLSLVLERLAGLLAPVLCHMAEDIWQNLPYPVEECSVFERGWPSVPTGWRTSDSLDYTPERHALIKELLLVLRPLVNRQLEQGRKQGQLGASLEAGVQIVIAAGDPRHPIADALQLLDGSPHPEVDNLADWLLVSSLQVGGPIPNGVLTETSEAGLTLRITAAPGHKCERCWHFALDIGQDSRHPTVCGRCLEVLVG